MGVLFFRLPLSTTHSHALMSNEADVWWKPTHQRAAKSIAQFTISESFHRPPPPPPVKRVTKSSSASSPDASQSRSPDSPLQIIAQVAVSDDPLPVNSSNTVAPRPSLTSRKRARPGSTLSDPPPPHKKKLSSTASPIDSRPSSTHKRAGRPRKNSKNLSHVVGVNGTLADPSQIPLREGRVGGKIPVPAKEEQTEEDWSDDERGIILSIFGSLYPSDENSDEGEEEEEEEELDGSGSELGLSESDEYLSDVAHTDDSSVSDFSGPGSPFLSSDEEEDESPLDQEPSHVLEDELLALSLPRTRPSPRTRSSP